MFSIPLSWQENQETISNDQKPRGKETMEKHIGDSENGIIRHDLK